MRINIVLVALFVAVSAMPAHHHGDHRGGNPIATSDAATPAATAQTGDREGGHRGGRPNNAPPSNNNPPNNNPPASTGAAATISQTGNQPSSTSTSSSGSSGPINPALVPDFGQQAGLDPDGTGNCKADSGKIIPCKCPPDCNAFIAKLNDFVSAGSFFGQLDAPFPTGNSAGDQLARIDTIISTLQNFDGSPGAGCPAAAAPNFAVVQCQAIKATGATCNSPAAGG